MIDRALATTRVIDAAKEIRQQITGTHLAQMPKECARLIVFLWARVDDYNTTTKPNPPNVDDDNDHFTGGG